MCKCRSKAPTVVQGAESKRLSKDTENGVVIAGYSGGETKSLGDWLGACRWGKGNTDVWVQGTGFHGAKLQTGPWILELTRAAILKVCLDVPLIGRSVRRHSLMPVGLFYSFPQNNHVLPRDFIFSGFVGLFLVFVPCPSVHVLLLSWEERK